MEIGFIMSGNRRKTGLLLGTLVVLMAIILLFIFRHYTGINPINRLLSGKTTYQSQPIPMRVKDGTESMTGMIYKRVTFSELPPGINSHKRSRQFLKSTTSKLMQDPGRGTNDSTVIMDGDTVWQVIINPFPAHTSGSGWYAEMQLNGADDSDDTLTYAMLTFYMKLSSNWDWANGGKLIGLGGKDADGHFPPGGGVRDPKCDTPQDYELDDGFSVRGGFDFEDDWSSPDGEIGYYVYHQGFRYKECRIHYGDTWNSLRTHDLNMSWEFDHWYKITHRIVLNTPGKRDGILEWYRNDTCYLSLDSIRFRNFDYIRLDYFMLETFQGGDKVPGYKGAKVWYDDLTLWSDHDRSSHNLGHVMEYTPLMPTPNVDR